MHEQSIIIIMMMSTDIFNSVLHYKRLTVNVNTIISEAL